MTAPRPPAITPTFTLHHRVLWRDVDALRHVNNATYLSYVEEARLAYQKTVLGTASRDAMPWVVAEARCRYLSPIVLDEDVATSLRVLRVGRSSVTIGFRIDAGLEPARLAAEGEVVQVHVDLATGRATSLPAAWRTAVEGYERAHGGWSEPA